MLAMKKIYFLFYTKTEKSLRSECRGKRLKLNERVADLRGTPSEGEQGRKSAYMSELLI